MLTSSEWIVVASGARTAQNAKGYNARAIVFLEAGTATVTYPDGTNSISFAVVAGLQLPGYIKAVAAASNAYALYWE